MLLYSSACEQNETDFGLRSCDPVVARNRVTARSTERISLHKGFPSRTSSTPGGSMTATSKCARPACNCVPPEGEKYCSAICGDAKGMAEITCQCQHAACQSQALK